MPVAVAISVEEYLGTTYRPDRDYIDGEVLERNVGEVDHSFLQTALAAYLWNRRGPWGITPLTEVRVQVEAHPFPSARRHRSRRTQTQNPHPSRTAPPLHRSSFPRSARAAGRGAKDRRNPPVQPRFGGHDLRVFLGRPHGRTQETIEDYLAFGVPCVWLVNPRTRRGFIYTSEGMHEAKDGILRVAGTPIEVPLAGLE